MTNNNINKLNIAFCKSIVFFLLLTLVLLMQLVVAQANKIIFLQNKEFSNFTKLIPKGLDNLNYAPLFSKNELALNNYTTPANAANAADSLSESKAAASLSDNVYWFKVSASPADNNIANRISSKQATNPVSASIVKSKVNKKPLLFQYIIDINNNNTLGLKNKNILNYNFKNGISNNNNYFFNTNTLHKQLAGVSNYPTLAGNKNWYLNEDLIKLLNSFFKSIYCLISKPKFINTPDKLKIEILYYITIPQNNIFKWYNFIYNTKKVIAFNYIKNIVATPIEETLGQPITSSALTVGTRANISRLNKKKVKVQKWNRLIKLILKKNSLVKKTLFNLNKTNITNLYFNKFLILFKLLNSYFKKPIELNLIRLHKSDYDSNILAQLFFLILKRKNIKSAISKLYFKNKIGMVLEGKDINFVGANKKNLAKFIPAYISGLYIHIGGRLLKEKIVPKKTTKKFEKGAIATGKINFLDTARITKKNKKGAFTIKIAYAQNFRFENIK